MSYGLSVRVASVASVAAAVSAEFDKVEASQPMHLHDRKQATQAATALVGVIGEPGDNQEISVSVSGSLQWRNTDDGPEITGVGLNVSASFVPKT